MLGELCTDCGECVEVPGRRDRDGDMTEAHPIEAESYRIMRSRIDLSCCPADPGGDRADHPLHRRLRYVTDLVRDEMALAAGVEALAATRRSRGRGHGRGRHHRLPVICRSATRGAPGRAHRDSAQRGPVRLAHGEAGPGAVWLVGRAPTALAEIMSRQVEPALVIGVRSGSSARWTPRTACAPAACRR